MIKLVFIILLFGFLQVNSQNVGIGTATPHPSSKLEIQTNNSGLLVPRLTTAERNAIVNPAHALMIYNLTTDCLEIYNANTNVWIPIGCTGCQLPGNFVATAATGLTSNSFTANWTTSFGATSYILEVATDAAFTSYVTGYNNLNVGFVTSFNVTGLNCGTTYYYRVKASNACGTTPVTNTISVILTGSGTVIFDYVSNTYQTWTVPPCVTSITIKAWGAGGGGGGANACTGGYGGGGAYSTATVTVTPGHVLHIYVGRGGGGGIGGTNNCITSGGFGGWGWGSGGTGGSAGDIGLSGAAGGGGGSTAVRNNNTNTLYVVAAGGGGGGGGGGIAPCAGTNGGGGGQNGFPGGSGTPGVAGAAATANGTNGGNRGCGGDGGGGGGGGGGYTNGGTGATGATCDCGAHGGGGGNSYSLGTVTNGNGQTPGNNTDPDLCAGCGYGGVGGAPINGNGQNGGHGRVVIIY